MTTENPLPSKSTLDSATFESALGQLQAAVKNLESGDLSLEQSLQQFEDGIRLSRICQGYLSHAEQRVEMVLKATSEGSLECQTIIPRSNA